MGKDTKVTIQSKGNQKVSEILTLQYNQTEF